MTITRQRPAFGTVKLLVGGYVALSVLTLVAIVLLRDHHDIVTDAVWVRATIVVGSSLLTAAFTRQAAGGSARGYLRLRLVSAIMLVAIVAIVALPGVFPVWLRVEQAGCGVLLLGVVLLVNGARMRSAFNAK
jgi:hypothetical protein